MHHAAPAQLEPFLATGLGVGPPDGELGAWFDEREVRRLQARAGTRTQERGRHLGDRAAQIGHRHALPDHERFELVELRLVGGVHGLVAEDPAGHDHLEGRRVGAHVAHLHRARVGPQQASVGGPEGVLGVARGVLGREVERFEVVVVVLELGADGDVVAEAAEHVEQPVGHLGEQVVAAGRHPLPGKGEVDALRREASVERGALQSRLARFDRVL